MDQLCGRVALNFCLNNFEASTGWLDGFKDCQQLTYRHVCNKSVSVDKNIVSYWNNHLLCRHWEVTVQKTTLMRLASFSTLFPGKYFQLEKVAMGKGILRSR
jgi:hypothetical protein